MCDDKSYSLNFFLFYIRETLFNEMKENGEQCEKYNLFRFGKNSLD